MFCCNTGIHITLHYFGSSVCASFDKINKYIHSSGRFTGWTECRFYFFSVFFTYQLLHHINCLTLGVVTCQAFWVMTVTWLWKGKWHVDSYYTLMSLTLVSSTASCGPRGLCLVSHSSVGHTAWLGAHWGLNTHSLNHELTSSIVAAKRTWSLSDWSGE